VSRPRFPDIPPRAPAQPRSARLARALRAFAGMVLLGLSLIPWHATPARAEGQSDGFRQAAQMWLNGPESDALRDLAELAQAGDPSARLLLGLIDKTPALQGPWLSRLTRAQRLALMRAPGGLSGRSWLNFAHGQPVAEAWRELHLVDADLGAAQRLAELGEARAAREAVLTLAARDRLTLPESWSWPDWMDSELTYVVWARARNGLRENLAAQVPIGHPQRGLMGLPADGDALGRWLADSPAASPLRAICDADCPETRETCLSAAYQALGSHNAVLTLGSPAESLISGEDFLASRRGRGAVLRRILLTADARGRRGQINRARETDACLADLLYAEADRYRHIREGSEAALAED
jgi:hypothetical protein